MGQSSWMASASATHAGRVRRPLSGRRQDWACQPDGFADHVLQAACEYLAIPFDVFHGIFHRTVGLLLSFRRFFNQDSDSIP